MTRGRTQLGAVVCAVLLVAGCTGESTGGKGSGGNAGAPAAHSDTATAQQHDNYGYAAVPDGVDYQPDVVVVGGGAAAVRSASSDGLTWAIERSAPGAGRLQLGKVLLMTSVVAGRVVALHDDGATRVVTIAPVLLTDVLRNGTIAVDQAVTGLKYQPVPGLAPGVTTPTKDDLPSSLVDPAMVAPGGGGSLPPNGSAGATIPVGNWKLKPAAGGGKLGLGIEYNAAGLKFFGDVSFTTSNLRFKAGLAVKNGKSTGPSFRIDGITGLVVSLAAGVADSTVDNTKATITLPGEFDIKIPPTPATAELPFTLSVKYKLTVTTAMTGDNSTLLATGKWKLDGPIGFEGQQPLTPSFSVQQSILDSVHGITLGPSGVVVAINVKAQLGLGPAQLNAGPNTGVTVSIGLTNGSSLGASLARCKGASLDLDLTYGAGISINIPYEILKYVLPAKTKLNFGIESKKNVLHREQIVPSVALCGG